MVIFLLSFHILHCLFTYLFTFHYGYILIATSLASPLIEKVFTFHYGYILIEVLAEKCREGKIFTFHYGYILILTKYG